MLLQKNLSYADLFNIPPYRSTRTKEEREQDFQRQIDFICRKRDALIRERKEAEEEALKAKKRKNEGKHVVLRTSINKLATLDL